LPTKRRCSPRSKARTWCRRARIGGTVASLSVTWGDVVKPGQVIAVVGDDKLLLQIRSLDAQIAGLQSQVTQVSPRPEAADRWTDKDLYDLAVKLRTKLIKVDDIGTRYRSRTDPR
jgi:multidrug efflux pump subunit AcrA (membrane-fusion protein)